MSVLLKGTLWKQKQKTKNKKTKQKQKHITEACCIDIKTKADIRRKKGRYNDCREKANEVKLA